MEYRAEFAITLPEKLLETLGIDEDTLFEAYFDNGKIKVRILDEDEFEDDDGSYYEDEVFEECAECPHYCRHCGVCTLDE
jgi:hypothetical protein